MSGYEIEELGRIEDAIDALESPTSEDVFQALRPFDERAIGSVAAQRAGGGSQPVTPFTVEDSNGDIVFQIDEDGTLHIRDGAQIATDL